MTTAHKETLGRFTIRIEYDDMHELADAVNDEPVMIFGRDRGHDWEVLDQSKRNFPSMDTLRAIEQEDIDEILNLLTDMRYSDWGRADSGKFWADHPDWIHARNHNGRRYFKIKDAMAAALFQAEHGYPMADLKVESFYSRTYQGSPVYYLAFWQSELDAYAGSKDAPSCLPSCQSIVDGDVYGYVIEDEEGNDVESCWGFIGDMDYCPEEARTAAQGYEDRARNADAEDMAEAIAAARPDLAPVYATA